MNYPRHLTLSACALAAATLAGCAAIDTAQNVYSAAKTGYTIKSAAADVKDIREAEPVFAGYSSVLVYSQVNPRDKDVVAAVPGAFNDSLAYLVQQLSVAAGGRLNVCSNVQACTGRVISVQFHEEAYNSGWAEKLTMGSQLKGKLSYVDNATGRVVAEKRIEGVKSYAEILGLIRASLVMSMSRSYGSVSPEAFNSVPAVKPGYERVLASS